MEWLHQAVNRLTVSDNQVEILLELKVALSSLDTGDISSEIGSLNLSPIFDSLNTSNNEQLELACDVLGKLLAVMNSRSVLAQYGPQIQRTLLHPSPYAKELVLKEIDQAVGEQTEMVEQLSAEQALLISIVDCISHENTSVARYASALLKHLGRCSAGLTALYSPALTEALNSAMGKSDVVRFRVYEVIVSVTVKSEEGLAASDRSGYLKKLIEEVQGDDVLTQLNALEMLTSVALCQHGVTYLDQQGILNSLADKLINSNNDPLASLVVPGLLKFFGNVAQARPAEMMQRFPAVVSMMFETLESPDTTLMAVGMETLGYIASTLAGKYMLNSMGRKVPEILRQIVEKLPSVSMDIRVRFLNSIANMLHLKDSDQNNQSLTMTRQWFESLCHQPLDFVLSVCRQPFPEMRLAGFQILQIIAVNPWGQEYIARAPGIVEYLLDRSTESLKTCTDAKFDVVKSLVESSSSISVFSPEILARLNEFVKQGGYFAIGETEVAIEGAS